MLSSQRTAWFKGHLRKVGTAAGLSRKETHTGKSPGGNFKQCID